MRARDPRSAVRARTRAPARRTASRPAEARSPTNPRTEVPLAGSPEARTSGAASASPAPSGRSPPPAPPTDPDACTQAPGQRRGSPPPAAPSSAPARAPRDLAAPWDRRPPCSSSREPALAAAVVLGVPEVLPSCPAEPQIELLHVGVARQRRSVAVQHHPSRLEDVAVVREAERRRRVLLGKEKAHLLAPV